VVLTTPADYVESPVRRMVTATTIVGMAVLGLSGLAAWLGARQVSRGIASASSAAWAMAHGAPVHIQPSPIREVTRLGAAIEESSSLLATRARERDENLARLKTAGEALRRLNENLEERVAQRTSEAEARATQLRALAMELTRAEQRERQRIAQTLHDHLQQVLVAAKMHATTAMRLDTTESRQATAVQQVESLIGAAMEISRNLTVELWPPVLTEMGMGAGLRWLARHMQDRHGLVVQVDALADAEPADETMRSFLFQAARELLFNVVKHAGVEQAAVRLWLDEERRTCLSVCDAGTGIKPARVGSERDASGFGLFSIRERLAHLGGQLRVESVPGERTCITLVMPVHEPGQPGPQPAPPRVVAAS
jgi:signal transduction histidine kinase